MFCPSCGAEYPQKTNFCKRCGANMNPTANSIEVHMPRPRVAGMVWAIALFSTAGLIASMVFLNELIPRNELSEGPKIFAFVASLMFVLGISGMLVWQLARMIGTWQHAVQQSAQKAQNELAAQSQPALPQPQYQPAPVAANKETVPSVTEHTTRSFNPAMQAGPGARE
ncbi:MAG TPA: zinc ribbon domain-containing protein [Blastocatellia bacterium]|nr:zinc ribbon domain-containing protein [Blastocatellia bacterium]